MQNKQKEEEKTFKIGKIELEINTEKSPYIPTGGIEFVNHGDILETLAIGIKENLPILLIGESGTGKTSAIRYLAEKTKNGLRRINLTGGTTADELVGRLLINEKGTYWTDGVLTEAMRNGEWVVLDEINAALPEVLFVLQSILDDDGKLTLLEKDDKEIVKKHPNFRLFGTCNPPEYAGTKEMNQALLSRFAICISAEFPTEKKETEIIKNHLGTKIAESELTTKLLSLANRTRKEKENGKADYLINTRDVLNTLRLAEYMEPQDAIKLAFSNKLDTADNKALGMMAKLELPARKRGATTTEKEIKSHEELTIGGTYILKADIRNAYLALTADKDEFEKLIKQDLGDTIQNSKEENGTKNDEFIIEGIYYENESEISKTELTSSGDKVASAIRITTGPNKDKKAIIIHHENIGDTAEIIKNIYEIN